jgi:hypothetical protein
LEAPVDYLSNPRTTPTLFHVTSTAAAISILESDEIVLSGGKVSEVGPSKGYPFFMSAARTLGSRYIKSNIYPGYVVLVLDWEKIRAHLRTLPVDFWDSPQHGNSRRKIGDDWSESEERIVSKSPKILNASQYIMEILWVLPKTDPHGVLRELRRLILLARPLDIPIGVLELTDSGKIKVSEISEDQERRLFSLARAGGAEDYRERFGGAAQFFAKQDAGEKIYLTAGDYRYRDAMEILAATIVCTRHFDTWPLWVKKYVMKRFLWSSTGRFLAKGEAWTALHSAAVTPGPVKDLAADLVRISHKKGFPSEGEMLHHYLTEVLPALAKERGISDATGNQGARDLIYASVPKNVWRS